MKNPWKCGLNKIVCKERKKVIAYKKINKSHFCSVIEYQPVMLILTHYSIIFFQNESLVLSEWCLKLLFISHSATVWCLIITTVTKFGSVKKWSIKCSHLTKVYCKHPVKNSLNTLFNILWQRLTQMVAQWQEGTIQYNLFKGFLAPCLFLGVNIKLFNFNITMFLTTSASVSESMQ